MMRPWATGAPTAAWTSPPAWAPTCWPSARARSRESTMTTLMGTCVVVDHGDGLTSIYCNLSAKPTVSEGDTVSTGTVLGVVGETAIAESSRPSHLHLEMAQDGQGGGPCELPAPALKDQKSSTPLMGVEPFAVCGIILSPAPPCLSPREKGPLQAPPGQDFQHMVREPVQPIPGPGSPMASPGSLAVSSRAKRPGR